MQIQVELFTNYISPDSYLLSYHIISSYLLVISYLDVVPGTCLNLLSTYPILSAYSVALTTGQT